MATEEFKVVGGVVHIGSVPVMPTWRMRQLTEEGRDALAIMLEEHRRLLAINRDKRISEVLGPAARAPGEA
jgi:hypothetical protein